MALDVRLVDHVEAVLAGQLVPPLRLRIMRIANRIKVGTLHQADIGQHRFFVDYMPGDIVVLMQVGTFEAHVFTVD